jgi:hypothetical protein
MLAGIGKNNRGLKHIGVFDRRKGCNSLRVNYNILTQRIVDVTGSGVYDGELYGVCPIRIISVSRRVLSG